MKRIWRAEKPKKPKVYNYILLGETHVNSISINKKNKKKRMAQRNVIGKAAAVVATSMQNESENSFGLEDKHIYSL